MERKTKRLSIGQLSAEQTVAENRKAFVQRLVDAGWKLHEAEQEWKSIQADEESGT